MTAVAEHGLARLAAFAAGLRCPALPLPLVEKTRACLLYGAAVGIAAQIAPQPRLAMQAVAGCGSPVATRFLDGAVCGAEDAAFANAVLFHARCQEDAHPAGHVGAVVLPAALATAEAVGASGAELVAAVVAGYEVALRIGRDHAVELSRRGFRTTPAYGVFGAAAASARLLQLAPAAMTEALALSASMACGLREFVEAGSEEFAYQAGVAARNGMLAARLAAVGAKGSASALTGGAGFFAAFGGPGGAYAERLADELGSLFEMQAVAFKPWPVCQFHRAVIAGLLELRARSDSAAVAQISIRMHPAEADFWGVRFAGPFQRFPQAFMSAPFCAALAWTKGAVTFAGLHEFADPAVLDLVPRVQVTADVSCPRYAPRLRVMLADGAVAEWDAAAADADFRLDWAAALRLAAALCAEAGVPERAVAALASTAATIDLSADVRPLISAIRTALSAGAPAQR